MGEEFATRLGLAAHHEVEGHKTEERVFRKSPVVPTHRVLNIVMYTNGPESLVNKVALAVGKEGGECPREEWLGAIELV